MIPTIIGLSIAALSGFVVGCHVGMRVSAAFYIRKVEKMAAACTQIIDDTSRCHQRRVVELMTRLECLAAQHGVTLPDIPLSKEPDP